MYICMVFSPQRSSTPLIVHSHSTTSTILKVHFEEVSDDPISFILEKLRIPLFCLKARSSLIKLWQ